jgi:hypothetical protein
VNFKIRRFLAASGGCCAAALLLIVFGGSAVHAQAVDPNIDLYAAGCSQATQPQLPQITYAAKPGDDLSMLAACMSSQTCPEISVKSPKGNVTWRLTPDFFCTGANPSIQCAPDNANADYRFNVTAPPGQAQPGNPPSAGNVKITNAGTITNADIGRQGIFLVNVKDAQNVNTSCTWDYLVHVTSTGGGWGDPHMTTVDGVHYDFQSAGEFTALKEDKFEVQTRQRPVPTTTVPGPSAYTGLGVCVSTYSAVAARIGSNRVTLQPNLSGQPDPSGLQLRVNGRLVTLTDRGIDLRAGGSTASSAQLEGRIVKAAGGAYEFDDARGTQLVATPAYWDAQQTWYMNLAIYQTSASKGIWGHLADESWLPALPDGTSLGSKPGDLDPRYQDLYVKFANAWRVTDATSLFDYAPGTNTATFTVADWPRFQPKSCDIQGQTSAPPATQQVAEQACNGVNADQKANCTFDVMVTGNPGFGDTYRTTQGFQPHGNGWQPVLAGVGVPTPNLRWWWILILILVLIVIAVLIARKKKAA